MNWILIIQYNNIKKNIYIIEKIKVSDAFGDTSLLWPDIL